MPAVTASDLLVLPRIERPDPGTTTYRPVSQVITSPSFLEGAGFPVRRPFPGPYGNIADPFLLLDHIGAIEYAPGEARGAPWHPHRGFETVTYIMDGAFRHQDSNGGGGLITDGATQWMTAGAGILHIETPPEALVISGGLFHGIQLWVNLPSHLKFTSPAYQPIEAPMLSLLSSQDGGSLVRVIAGEVGGYEGPGSTRTPITFVHATISPGARLHVPWLPDFTALVYALAGRGSVASERRPVSGGQ